MSPGQRIPLPALQCAGRVLDFSNPLVMGVINTTPDSFSDGGTLYRSDQLDLDRAMERASAMVASGAAVLDVGGESTRPGAASVSVQQELDRVVPLVSRISEELDVVVSVDTSTPEVMHAAAGAGAGMLNDVRALRREGALEAAAATQLPICLMHMQGEPSTMQRDPSYDDVVAEVAGFLQTRATACMAVGIPRDRLMVDPGFGFGKTVAHNLQLLAGLPTLAEMGMPILVGLSRKSMIGKLIGREVYERLPASLALAVMAAERGANLIRTHDVAETADAVSMLAALRNLGEE